MQVGSNVPAEGCARASPAGRPGCLSGTFAGTRVPVICLDCLHSVFVQLAGPYARVRCQAQ